MITTKVFAQNWLDFKRLAELRGSYTEVSKYSSFEIENITFDVTSETLSFRIQSDRYRDIYDDITLDMNLIFKSREELEKIFTKQRCEEILAAEEAEKARRKIFADSQREAEIKQLRQLMEKYPEEHIPQG